MYLHLLTPPQQLLFLESARALVERDGKLEDVEADLLRALSTECGVSGDDAFTAPRDSEALAEALNGAFDTSVARRVLLLELAGVAVIDGDAHVSELTLLEEIAAGVGISSADLGEMVQFGLDALSLVTRGKELIATGSQGS